MQTKNKLNIQKHITVRKQQLENRKKILNTLMENFPDIYQIESKKLKAPLFYEHYRPVLYCETNPQKDLSFAKNIEGTETKNLELICFYTNRHIPITRLRKLELSLIRLLDDDPVKPVRFLFLRHSTNNSQMYFLSTTKELQILWLNSQNPVTHLYKTNSENQVQLEDQKAPSKVITLDEYRVTKQNETGDQLDEEYEEDIRTAQ